MKLFLKILLFVLVVFQTNVTVATAFVFDNAIIETKGNSENVEYKNEIAFIFENDFGITCKSESNLVDYRNLAKDCEAYAAKGVFRSLDDLSSLKGASWDEANSLIPKDWISGPLKKGEGVKFVNPAKKGEQILLEKGWPGAKDPLHAGPYMKISRDGQITRIPLQGNPALK